MQKVCSQQRTATVYLTVYLIRCFTFLIVFFSVTSPCCFRMRSAQAQVGDRSFDHCQLQRLPSVGAASPAAALTLNQACGLALSVDRELVASDYEAAAAHDQLASIRRKNTINLDILADYSFGSDNLNLAYQGPAPIGNIPLGGRRLGHATATLTKPLYRGGQAFHEKLVGKIDIELAQLNARYARRALRIKVVEAFVAVLRSQSQLRLAKLKLELQTALAADATNRRTTGTASHMEGLGIQAALENSRFQHESAQVAVDNANTEFNRLLGRPADTPVRLAVPQLPESASTLPVWLEEAHCKREEIHELKAIVRQSLEKAQVVRKGVRPNVYLHGGILVLDNEFLDPNALGQLGVAVDWRVSDGGRRKNEAAAIEKRASGLAQTLATVQAKIEAEVRATYRLWQSSAAAVRAAEANLAYQKACFRADQEKRQQGMMTRTDMLRSRSSLAAAADKVNQAVLDAVFYGHQLQFVSGD